MISRLKQECGSAFTVSAWQHPPCPDHVLQVKLEGMFKDMDVSNDIMNAFRNRAQSAEEPKQEVCIICASALLKLFTVLQIELSVRVLTKGSWPNYPKMEVPTWQLQMYGALRCWLQVCLPAQLQVLHEVGMLCVCGHLRWTHAGLFRILFVSSQWVSTKLRAHSRAVYAASDVSCWSKGVTGAGAVVAVPSHWCVLQVSLLQALVLLLFNDVDSLTFEEIRKGWLRHIECLMIIYRMPVHQSIK